MRIAPHSKPSAWILILALMAGCGGERVETKESKAITKARQPQEEADQADSPAPAAGPRNRFQAVTLDGDSASGAGAASTGQTPQSAEKRAQEVVAALQPLQVLLGQWRWTTNRKFPGAAGQQANKSAEDLEWIWDFKHDAAQPALTAKSEAHPYFRQVWLTFFPEENQFQATAKGVDGDDRAFRGTWTDGGEPQEVSDGKKIQHVHKLQLTQNSPAGGEQWQFQMSQLDNNQYLVTMTRSPAPGKPFVPLDVVRQQRLGTSFAVADSDNPGPKCIISGGLGTMTVSYQGKSYPVCCSGCAAAFNDDPQRWLAKWAEREKAKKRNDDD